MLVKPFVSVIGLTKYCLYLKRVFDKLETLGVHLIKTNCDNKDRLFGKTSSV